MLNQTFVRLFLQKALTPNSCSYIIKIQTNVRGDYMNTRRRRRRQQFQITLLLMLVVLLFFIILFSQLSSNTIIGSKDIEVSYISVKVLEGDTLWDLGNEFVDQDYYTLEEYIHKIISINGLKSEIIYPGQRLTMPVIKEQFVTVTE